MARTSRHALLLRTALGGLALGATPALAAVGMPTNVVTNTGGGAPLITTPDAVTTNIQLNAARTVLQYTGFTVAGGETVNFRFGNRGDLAVVHATQAAIQIDGTLQAFVGATYGGNVWLLSNAGVMFGATARVDVGGLLASTSVPSNLLDPAGPVLTPTALAFDFGDGAGAVTVTAGAQLTGHGGSIALLAPSVVTGAGATIGGDGHTAVLYGAAQRYTLRFAREAGDDLDLLDFEVPGLTAGTTAAMPLMLAGTTSAGNVYVASVGRADALRAVISAGGDITATTAGTDGGSVVLSAGGGIANRAAAPLMTDGVFRQDLIAGKITAGRDVRAGATGNVDLGGAVDAGGSIVATALNVTATTLTAGQDIIIRTGDATGSTGGGGYGYGGYGYGALPYGPEGGGLVAHGLTAGDDIVVTAFGSSISLDDITLAGIGPDAAGDPLGTLDAAGDGRRLLLRTTGADAGGVYLGNLGDGPGHITGGTDLRIESGGGVQASLAGPVTLTAVTAADTASVVDDGDLTIGSIAAPGAMVLRATGAIDIGSATTTLDAFDNGQIVLEGGTRARLGTGNAATDIIVVADGGDATVTAATAGDDLIVRAFAGDVHVTSARVGAGGAAPDVDGSVVNLGEGGQALFPDLELDAAANGRVIDLAAGTAARPFGGGGCQDCSDLVASLAGGSGGSVVLGAGTGTIGGYNALYVNADIDIDIDVASIGPNPADAYLSVAAGHDIRVRNRGGDLFVDYASAGRDLTLQTPAGTVDYDQIDDGQDLSIDASGPLVLGSATAPRDVTILGSSVDLASLDAGRDGSVTARTGDANVDQARTQRDLSVLALNGLAALGDAQVGRDLLLRGKQVTLGNLDGYHSGYGYGGYGYGIVTPTRDVTIEATAGDFLYEGPIVVTRDVTINTSGSMIVGPITAGDDIRLTGVDIDIGPATTTGLGEDTEGDGSNLVAVGSGEIDLHEFDVANDATITAGLDAIVGTNANGGRAGRDLRATGASVIFFQLRAGRDMYLTATADTLYNVGFDSEASLFIGRDLSIDVATDLVTGDIGAPRNVTVIGASLDLGTVSGSGDVTVTTRSGPLSVFGADAGDDVRITGAGPVLVREASTSGMAADSEGDGSNIVVTGPDVTVMNASAATDLIVEATGTATVDGSAGRDARIRGALLALGPIDAGRDAVLAATAGAIDATTLHADRDLIVTTPALLSFDDASAERDVLLTGVGIAGGDVHAGRDATLVGGAGLLRADVVIADDDVRLSAATIDVDIARATGTGVDSEPDGFNVVATGGTITLEQVFAATDIRVTGTEMVTIGIGAGGDAEGVAGDYYAEAGNDIVLTGASLLTGPLDAGRDVILTATAGGIDARGEIDAGRDVTALATGAASFAAPIFAGQDIRLQGATLVTNGLDAGRDLFLTANSLMLGDVASRRDATITALTGDATIASANVARDLTVLASMGLARVDAARVGRDLTMRGRSVRLGTLDGYTSASQGYGYGYGGTFTRTRDVLLDASAGDVTVTGDLVLTRDLTVTATGAIAAAAFDAGGNARLDAGGALSFGAGDARTDLTLAGNSVTGGAVSAGRDVTATARTGGLSLGDIAAGDDARLSAALDASLGVVTASGTPDSEADGGNIVVNSRALVLGGATATTDVVIVATGALTPADGGALAITAGRDALITAASLSTAGITAGRDLALTATAAGLAAGDLSAVRDLTLSASGALTAGTTSAGRDLLLTGASIAGGAATAGRDATATTAGALTLGDVTAGDDIRLTGGGAVTTGGLTAIAATADTEGDGANVIVTGATIATGAVGAGTDARLTATGALTTGNVTAGRDIVLSGATLGTGTLSAGRDLSLTATAGAYSGASSLTAVRDLTVDAVGITLGSATAGRDLNLNARTGTLTLASGTAGDDARLQGATQSLGQVRATGLGMDSEGDGSNVVITGGAITASQLQAATDIVVTGSGAVSIGQATAGRDVSVSGGTVGGALQLSGRDVAVTSGGALTATAGLSAARDLRLTAGTTLSFTQLNSARDLFLTAATVAGGSAVAARDLTVVATIAITGDTYQAGRDLILDPNEAINAATVRAGGNASLVGASVIVGTLDVGGTTSVLATAGGIALDSFRSTGAAQLIATGRVDLGDSTTPALRVVGGDLDVRRSLVASSLTVETPGRMVLGGTAAAGETGFRLAAADIGRLQVSGVASFYAGLTTSTDVSNTAGGDLIVQDFAYDPAKLPRLALFADRNHVVDIQGIVAPSDVGGALQIGDANPNGVFRPASIYVSGGLGTAELIASCFGQVVPANSLSLYTVGDVIFGDAGFRAAVQATPAGSIDIFAGVPATPRRTDDRLFAVTTRLIVQAGGKIVSQNTASADGGFVGVVLIGTGATGPIVDIDGAAAADLSGSIVDSAGILRSGPLVARAAELGLGGINGAIFRFNGCIVGGGICSAGSQGLDTPSEALRIEDYQPPRPIDLTDVPLQTVLVADGSIGEASSLTVVNESNGIILRAVIDSTTLDRPAPATDGPDTPRNCNAVPGTDGSKSDCPAPAGPKGRP